MLSILNFSGSGIGITSYENRDLIKISKSISLPLFNI